MAIGTWSMDRNVMQLRSESCMIQKLFPVCPEYPEMITHARTHTHTVDAHDKSGFRHSHGKEKSEKCKSETGKETKRGGVISLSLSLSLSLYLSISLSLSLRLPGSLSPSVNTLL